MAATKRAANKTQGYAMPPDLFDKLLCKATRAKFSDGLINAAKAHAPDVVRLARDLGNMRRSAQERVLKESHTMTVGPLRELKTEAERPITIAEAMAQRGHL